MDSLVNASSSVLSQQSNLMSGKPGSASVLRSQQRMNGGQQARPSPKAQRGNRPGKAEQSLNHLLNFSYARPAASRETVPVRRSARTTPKFGLGSGHHPDDKAHFVNANYRFVVNPGGDYRANLSQSDIPIPWENVLQVLASIQTQCHSCTICLESVPMAPRMARCGHVFCLPCALRYLDSEDVVTGKATGKWRKCPICFDGIYERDLRPVKWVAGESELPEKGRDVTLRLIMRKSGSMLALPRDSPEVDNTTVPWYNQGEVCEYARIIKGDEEYMTAESSREIRELEEMRERDRKAFGDEGYWTMTAIGKITDLIEVYVHLGRAPNFKQTAAREHVYRPEIEYESTAEYTPDAFKDRDIGGLNIKREKRASLSSRRPETTSLTTSSGDAYYFYQPRAGAHYYLAPLDIRVLKKAFNVFSQFPSAIIAKVEHANTLTIDEDLRKRTKYLSHLPLGCEVTFLECDWSGVLDDSTLTYFKTDTEKRKKKRHDKAVAEETSRRRAIQLEERKERAGLGEVQWSDDRDTSYWSSFLDGNGYEVFTDQQESSPPLDSQIDRPPDNHEYQTTVWGTAARRQSSIDNAQKEELDVWKASIDQFEEDLAVQQVAASQSGKGKKGKKKLVLMTTNSGRGR